MSFIFNPYRFGAAAPPPWSNLKSIDFDGVDEWMDCGIVSEFNGATAMSISFWGYNTTYSVVKHVIGYLSTDNDFRCWMVGTRPSFGIQYPSGQTAAINASGNILPYNAWFHIALVYDASLSGITNIMKMYLNGVQVTNLGTSGTPPPSLQLPVTSFGVGGLNVTNSSDGRIDEPAIFDYALSASQIPDIYNSGSSNDLMNLAGITPPIHYWRNGDGDTFPTITDVGSVGGNNGTMINMEAGDIVLAAP